MASSPKIPKDRILSSALQILIRDGYEAVHIKSIARELGCSTQPVSWHFGNMEGLRAELSRYARDYAVGKLYRMQENAVLSFLDLGLNYLDIAFDEPNLFRYIFMNDCGGYVANSIRDFSDAGQNALLTEQIARQLGIPQALAATHVQDLTVFVHGLACYIATGVLHPTKEESKNMLIRMGMNLFAKNTQQEV